jgi:malate dehydrogenase (decarboxylating)
MLVAYAFLCYCCLMQGLITKNRKGLNPAVAPFARGHGPNEVQDLHEGASLVEVVW